MPDWFETREPLNKDYQLIIKASADKGEASAIALALELDDCLLILDDLKGRKFALEHGISITDTIGIIVETKLTGIISSVKPILARNRQTNFRITDQLESIILKRSGE